MSNQSISQSKTKDEPKFSQIDVVISKDGEISLTGNVRITEDGHLTAKNALCG